MSICYGFFALHPSFDWTPQLLSPAWDLHCRGDESYRDLFFFSILPMWVKKIIKTLRAISLVSNLSNSWSSWLCGDIVILPMSIFRQHQNMHDPSHSSLGTPPTLLINLPSSDKNQTTTTSMSWISQAWEIPGSVIMAMVCIEVRDLGSNAGAPAWMAWHWVTYWSLSTGLTSGRYPHTWVSRRCLLKWWVHVAV